MGIIVGFVRGTLTEQERDELRGLLDAEPIRLPDGSNMPPQLPPPVDTGVGDYFDQAPEFVQDAIRAHWPRETWERAAAIAYQESGWDPNAHNTNGEDSRGLWQINVVPQANADLLYLGDMFDPMVNANAAVKVWRRQGWAAWVNAANRLGIPLTGGGVA